MKTHVFLKIICSFLWVAKRQKGLGGITNPSVLSPASVVSPFLSTLCMTQPSLWRNNFSSPLTNHYRDFISLSLFPILHNQFPSTTVENVSLPSFLLSLGIPPIPLCQVILGE